MVLVLILYPSKMHGGGIKPLVERFLSIGQVVFGLCYRPRMTFREEREMYMQLHDYS